MSLCPPPPPIPSSPTAPVTLCPLQGPAKAAKGCRLMKTDGTVPQCLRSHNAMRAGPAVRRAVASWPGTAPVRHKYTRNQSSQTHVHPEPLQSDARTPGTAPVRRTYTGNHSSQTHVHREPLQSDARVPGTAPVRRTCTGNRSSQTHVYREPLQSDAHTPGRQAFGARWTHCPVLNGSPFHRGTEDGGSYIHIEDS